MAVLVKTLNGLAWASVKTRSGLAVASIKNINGLDTTAPTGITFLIGTAKGGTSSGVTTDAIDTTGADFIVMGVGDYTGVGASTISDSKGNTWNSLTAKTVNATRGRLVYTVPSSVGSGHTFSATGVTTYAAVAVMAFYGVNSTPFDKENGGVVSASTSLATGSITPAVDNTLIVSCLANQGAAITSPSLGGGTYTLGSQVSWTSNNIGIILGYLIQGSASAVNPSWAWTTNSDAAAPIANFKPA